MLTRRMSIIANTYFDMNCRTQYLKLCSTNGTENFRLMVKTALSSQIFNISTWTRAVSIIFLSCFYTLYGIFYYLFNENWLIILDSWCSILIINLQVIWLMIINKQIHWSKFFIPCCFKHHVIQYILRIPKLIRQLLTYPLSVICIFYNTCTIE